MEPDMNPFKLSERVERVHLRRLPCLFATRRKVFVAGSTGILRETVFFTNVDDGRFSRRTLHALPQFALGKASANDVAAVLAV